MTQPNTPESTHADTPESTHTDTPKLSIITPCYNAASYIEATIQSVRSQGYENVQHLIIDGDSTDDTLAVVSQFDHVEVYSEPDDGLYDALNKGLQRADGEFIGWLNADDMYVEGAFDAAITAYRQRPNCELIAGSTVYHDDSRQTQRKPAPFTRPTEFRRGAITHAATKLNACFLGRKLINRIGPFDQSLQIAGDTEYLVRIAATQPVLARTLHPTIRYRIHDEALTHNHTGFSSADELRFREGMAFMRAYLERDDLPAPLVGFCHHDYRYRATKLTLGYLSEGRLTEAVRTATEAYQFDPGLPPWLLSKVAQRLRSWW